MKYNIFLIITLATVFRGCVGRYEKMSHFTENEAKWLDAYDKDDRVYFRSSGGSLDTMIVYEKYYTDPLSPLYIYFDYDPGPYSHAYGYYKFYITSDFTLLHGKFSLHKSLENDTLSINSYLGTIGTLNATYGKGTPIDSIGLKAFRMDSEVYDNCLVFDDANTITKIEGYVISLLKDDIIKRYDISRDHGLIYYEKANGEIYKRDFNLSPAKKQ